MSPSSKAFKGEVLMNLGGVFPMKEYEKQGKGGGGEGSGGA